MTFDISKLKLSTKGLVAFLLGIGSLLQVPAIETPVFAAAKSHPHFAAALGALTGLIALLHNPKVEKLLGIQTDTTSDTVKVGEVSHTVTTTSSVPVAMDAIAVKPSVPASVLLPDVTVTTEAAPVVKETV